MSDWTSGYVADIGYTYGYYPELNPLRAKLAFIDAGIVCPTFGTACELGFGQGISTNFHAAGSVTEWYGTDFNPAQAGFAQELAAVSGAPARLFDEGFAEFARRADLPDFDYIGLHGIWSWISDENRAVIVDFVRRKLKVGGVLYISYNALPGWAVFAPMRHLMTEHAKVMGPEGAGIVSRINGAIDFSDKLMATNPAYTRALPQIAPRMEKIKEMSRHYLAHEYFNRDWHPMYFSRMAELLSAAKVDFACSAHLLDHVDPVNLSTDQQKFLKEIADPAFRETARDFIVNQQFRRDFWVKGARTMSRMEKDQAVASLRFVLVTSRNDVPLKITGGQGELSLKEEVYKPVLDEIFDHRPRTVEELAEAVKKRGVVPSQLLEMLLILVSAGHVALVQDAAVTDKALPATQKLNAHVIARARHSSDIGYLVSPVTGGGINVGRFQQLFLLGRNAGLKTSDEWAQSVWNILQLQGQRIVKEGKLLQTEEENLVELKRQAAEFEQKALPIMKILKIA